MCSAAALHIFSGKIILNRATPGGLRTARCGVFTGGAGAVSGRKNPLRLAMLASSPEGGASIHLTVNCIKPPPFGGGGIAKR